MYNVPFSLAVSMGKFAGMSVVDKFGTNPEITTASAPEDMWEYGGEYTYDTNGTAPINSIVSDNINDTLIMNVKGLDIDGYFVSQNITLNGTTRVALDTPLWRVYRMSNDDSVTLQGTAYCYVGTSNVPASADIRAMVYDGHNQTLMCLYTIPKGKVGFLWRGEMGVELDGNAASLAEYAHVHYESRRYGKIFKVKKAVTCLVGGNAAYIDDRSFKDPLPALTDLKLSIIEVTQTMGMWGTFDILLVDENQFTQEYLTSIGQV